MTEEQGAEGRPALAIEPETPGFLRLKAPARDEAWRIAAPIPASRTVSSGGLRVPCESHSLSRDAGSRIPVYAGMAFAAFAVGAILLGLLMFDRGGAVSADIPESAAPQSPAASP
jgi:hypothetical protein